MDNEIKDFKGYKISSTSSCVMPHNGKIIEKTIRKAFPTDSNSTLYIVQVEGIKTHFELYEDEMIK